MPISLRAVRRSVALQILALVAAVGLAGVDLFAQASVRSTNRSAEGRVTTSRATSGNSSTRTTQAQGRRGRSATGTRTVSRDGDTVTVDSNVTTGQGATVSSQKEIEVDNGRVESVERSVTTTDRYGRTGHWEGEAEREGRGWEFEGEGTTRTGRDVEVEGYGARGYYGSGVVADVEGGRYGDRTVVAGRSYGGPAYVRTLPYGARQVNYWGRPYYHHGGVYYRPYPVHGVVIHVHTPPPYFVYYPSPPVGAIVLTVAGLSLLYADGAYYKKTTASGTTQYQVVPAPAGASIPVAALPADCATITVGGGQTYFLYGNTFYRSVVSNGQKTFVAVTKPAGIITVKALPPEFDAVPVGSLTYFVANGRHYVPYLDPSGEEFYLVVNPPKVATPAAAPAPTPKPQTVATAAPSNAVAPVKIALTLNAGTAIPTIVTSEISSGKAKTGDRFQGYLQNDLVAEGRLIAPKGTRAYGRVVEATAGSGLGKDPVLTLELTDLEVGGQVYAIATNQIRLTAEGKKPGKKILGGAALGAGIGAIVDGGDGAAVGAVVGAAGGTAAAAASGGNQVSVSAGGALDFQFMRPFTVAVLMASGVQAE